MKEIVEYLKEHGIICKSLKERAPKELGSRKRVEIYFGVNLEDYYCAVMVLEKKSRVLRKEAAQLMELHRRLEGLEDTKILKKYILIKAPLCSHAKVMLEEDGWTVWHSEN